MQHPFKNQKSPIKPQNWCKLGCIVRPNSEIEWMVSHAGPSYALQIGDSSLFHLYITGRDHQNRSKIGRVTIDITQPHKILDISSKPVLDLGELGTFDENGVSYPYLVQHEGKTLMYYVGWRPTVLVPFSLNVGVAVLQADGNFKRLSKAPILPYTKDDYLGTGSCAVYFDQNQQLFRMYYTCFVKWGIQPTEHKHDYIIKYATSKDGIQWERNNRVCIDIAHPSEFAICHPTVWQTTPTEYHMHYAYRGKQYRIGYATSKDGIQWTRQDHLAGISPSTQTGAWDSLAQCYPQVFDYQKQKYMLYNGNGYGATGLGLMIEKTILH